MRVFPGMACCKEGRQRLGLTCDGGWMFGCLTSHCAGLKTPTERRSFADNIKTVERIARADLRGSVDTEVDRLLQRRKREGQGAK